MTGNQIPVSENLDMEKELMNMEKKLKEQEDQFTQFQKEKEKLKNSITRLKKAVNDINNSADAYVNAFRYLHKETEDIREYYRNQMSIFDMDFPGNRKNELNEKVKKAYKIKDDNQDKKDKCEKAKQEFQKAKKIRDEKQKEFDSIKILQKTIEVKLKEISDFKASIEEETKKGKKEHAYFLMEDKDGGLGMLIEELNQLIEDSGLKSFSLGSIPGASKAAEPGENSEAGEASQIKEDAREEFKNTLMKKWNELNQAEGELKDKEEAVKKAGEEYEKSQKAWEELQKDRKNKILEKYKDNENENKKKEVKNA